jgi:hypothetical protein
MAQRNSTQREISDEVRVAAEEQTRAEQKVVDYDTKEYTVELIVGKYLLGKDEDENELFIPEYQRDFVWDLKRQSKFIESVMLGLPIPYIFTAALHKDISEDEGRIEIVDGSQRVRTLAAFLNDELELRGLEKLDQLNGFKFSDLDISRQRKFKRRPVRVIELTDKADDQVRRDIFERINTGSDELSPMEIRKGVFRGPFYDFIRECAANSLFYELCPISEVRLRREESQEMILRYFAYADNYQNFSKSVIEFLDSFIKQQNDGQFDRERMKKEFETMLEFVKVYFPHGFRKGPNNKSVPRVRFEALAVGVTLALRVKPELIPGNVTDWLGSAEFKAHTVSDASNSNPKVVGRIEFVRDRLLGN